MERKGKKIIFLGQTNMYDDLFYTHNCNCNMLQFHDISYAI